MNNDKLLIEGELKRGDIIRSNDWGNKGEYLISYNPNLKEHVAVRIVIGGAEIYVWSFYQIPLSQFSDYEIVGNKNDEQFIGRL